jgi:hypothetical protein
VQTELPPSPARRLVAAAILALLLIACTAGEDPAPPVATATSDGVLESRAILGEPMVQLAESVIVLADELAAARYEAARGATMQQHLRALDGSIAGALDAAEAAAAAADEAPTPQAAQIVRDAAGQAVAAAAATEAEIAFLLPVSRVDIGLLGVTELWDRPGSQSEIRGRLDTAATDAAKLRRRARGLEPVPGRCRAIKRNRVGWAATVRTRTQRLQSQANSAGGGEFDDLRTAYRRLPLGVEPRTADQQERRCWRASSGVWGAADELRGAVEALEAALQ